MLWDSVRVRGRSSVRTSKILAEPKGDFIFSFQGPADHLYFEH